MVIEVVFDRPVPNDQRSEIGQSLTSFCEAASEEFKFSEPNTSLASDESQLAITHHSGLLAIDHFAKSVHRSLDLRQTAFEIANEVQALTDCDRVAVLRKTGNRWKAIAFSGQSELAARSNSIRALESLVGIQMLTGEPMWPDVDSPTHANEGSDDESAQVLSASLDNYQGLSRAREIVILPMRCDVLPVKSQQTGSQPATPLETQPPTAEQGEIVGALVLEQFGDGSLLPKRRGIELLQQHAESAFGNALTHQNLPFFTLIDRLGKLSSFRLRGRRNKLLAGLSVTALIMLLLVTVKIDFKIHADGTLLPEQRRNVFAEVDGEVQRVLVKHGDSVTAGQLLIQMTSDQLEIYLEELNGKISTTEKQIEAIVQAAMRADQRGADASQTAMLNVERSKLGEMLITLREELLIATQRKEKLNVKSPIDGQVLSWQLEHQLGDRPVAHGQRLLEIGRLDGAWIVELSLADKYGGKILEAQRRSKVPLKVTFMIASDTAKTFTGEVVEIAKATIEDPTSGRIIRVRAKINEDDADFRQVRTDVRAKVHLGKASLGYVWLHDLFEFVQSKILFRLL